MADFLLEIFSEEIPARMQAEALEHLKKALVGGLQKDGFAVDMQQARGFVTPRRLAVMIGGLAEEQPALSTEEKGPRVGAPDAAIEGFCRKFGIERAALTERDGTYYALIRREGKKTPDALKPLVEKLLADFPWPKSMRWGSGEISWVRPLHSILCLFGGAVVPVEFAGIRAGNVTRGHRFLAPVEIRIDAPQQYEERLERVFVAADREKRKSHIRTQAENVASQHGLALRPDEGLLEEVTGLVEWPVVLAGKIDAAFMDLPPEVLISEMRAHQKYFALQQADGSLADIFLITANMETSDGGAAIIAGNERVLRARLSDGRFFWDQDRKKPLEAWAKGLESVTYHAKLGSIAEKTERVGSLARKIASCDLQEANRGGSLKERVARAASLAKADLTTGMVGEFPELQGVMGRYYALSQGEPQAVADAIRDHYKPQGPADSVPTEPVAVCLALADKLDTLAGMFAIGEKPTGSKDPFALRRAALGVIRIILENGLRIGLRNLLPHALDAVRNGGFVPTLDVPKVTEELLAFLLDRLIVQMKDQGLRHDVIKASVVGDDDLVRIVARARAVQDFLASGDGTNLLAAYKRAANILKIEEKKDGLTYNHQDIEETLLREEAEKSLYAALNAALVELKTKTQKWQSTAAGPDDLVQAFHEMMRPLSALRAPVDIFFDQTHINDPNPAIRKNRLCLLDVLRHVMHFTADFAKIEG